MSHPLLDRRDPQDVKRALVARSPASRGYRSTPRGYWSAQTAQHDLPPFTLLHAQMMEWDPQLGLACRMRDAAILPAEVRIRTKNEALGRYLAAQWQRLWTLHGHRLLETKKIGWGGFEIGYGLCPDTRQLQITHLHSFAPYDVQALSLDREAAGVYVRRLPADKSRILNPSGLWTTFGAKHGEFYGTSIFRRAYSPWYERWMDHGSKKVLQLRMIRDAINGLVGWYPEGKSFEFGAEKISGRDALREMLEGMLAGGVMTLPSTVRNGTKEFDVTRLPDAGDPSHVIAWDEATIQEMRLALDVLPEIVQAAETGSGFSGRSIPMMLFLASCQVEFAELLEAINRQVLYVLAWIFCGEEPQYVIEPVPLVELWAQDVKGSPLAGSTMGGAAGSQGGPSGGAGGLAGLMDRLRSGAGGDAAPPPRQFAEEPESDFHDVRDALIELATRSADGPLRRAAEEILALRASALPEHLLTQEIDLILRRLGSEAGEVLRDVLASAEIVGAAEAVRAVPSETLAALGEARAPGPPAPGPAATPFPTPATAVGTVPPTTPPTFALADVFPAGSSVRFPTIEAAIKTLNDAPGLIGLDALAAARAAGAEGETLGRLLADDAIRDVRALLVEEYETGLDRERFLRRAAERLGEGSPLSAPRLEQIFRDNVGAHLAEAQERSLRHPVVVDFFPYRGRSATRDRRVRPEHLALEKAGLDGTNIYRADDPTWLKYRAPWDWNCRCADYPVTVEQAAKAGVREAREWWDRAKRLAAEEGVAPELVLSRVAPAAPEFVAPPPFDVDPEYRRQVGTNALRQFADEPGKRWITLNAGSGDDGDGGTRVQIDEATGKIAKGPAALAGRTLGELDRNRAKAAGGESLEAKRRKLKDLNDVLDDETLDRLDEAQLDQWLAVHAGQEQAYRRLAAEATDGALEARAQELAASIPTRTDRRFVQAEKRELAIVTAEIARRRAAAREAAEQEAKRPKTLAERIRGGDREALAEAFERQRADLTGYVRRNLSERMRQLVDPEDVVQDVATQLADPQLFEKVDFADRDLTKWFRQVAHRRIKDAHDKLVKAQMRTADRTVSANRPVGEGEADLATQLADRFDAGDEGAAGEAKRERVRRAIAALPDDARRLLELRYVEGLPAAQIAARIGKQDGAVRVALHRTNKRLEKLFREQAAPPAPTSLPSGGAVGRDVPEPAEAAPPRDPALDAWAGSEEFRRVSEAILRDTEAGRFLAERREQADPAKWREQLERLVARRTARAGGELPDAARRAYVGEGAAPAGPPAPPDSTTPDPTAAKERPSHVFHGELERVAPRKPGAAALTKRLRAATQLPPAKALGLAQRTGFLTDGTFLLKASPADRAYLRRQEGAESDPGLEKRIAAWTRPADFGKPAEIVGGRVHQGRAEYLVTDRKGSTHVVDAELVEAIRGRYPDARLQLTAAGVLTARTPDGELVGLTAPLAVEAPTIDLQFSEPLGSRWILARHDDAAFVLVAADGRILVGRRLLAPADLRRAARSVAVRQFAEAGERPRAPKGGVLLRGRFYPGGEYVPKGFTGEQVAAAAALQKHDPARLAAEQEHRRRRAAGEKGFRVTAQPVPEVPAARPTSLRLSREDRRALGGTLETAERESATSRVRRFRDTLSTRARDYAAELVAGVRDEAAAAAAPLVEALNELDDRLVELPAEAKAAADRHGARLWTQFKQARPEIGRRLEELGGEAARIGDRYGLAVFRQAATEGTLSVVWGGSFKLAETLKEAGVPRAVGYPLVAALTAADLAWKHLPQIHGVLGVPLAGMLAPYGGTLRSAFQNQLDWAIPAASFRAEATVRKYVEGRKEARPHLTRAKQQVLAKVAKASRAMFAAPEERARYDAAERAIRAKFAKRIAPLASQLRAAPKHDKASRAALYDQLQDLKRAQFAALREAHAKVADRLSEQRDDAAKAKERQASRTARLAARKPETRPEGT